MSAEETLQQQVEEEATRTRQGFGTFAGVFTPTLLTILGVIMYLRLGWVVGNVGLMPAFLIILLAFAITGFTGLSLSSITTNIRVGAGGAFNMISQSLGLEIGGSIGIPLFFSQALAVSMYVFGFREGWRFIFPDHPALVVDLAVFLLIFVIAFISAGLAFRVQYLIMAVIIGSLISMAVAAFTGSMTETIRWSAEPQVAAGISQAPFWTVFAVFFPAATGIMAGANISGDLENPRRSIPIGTMAAIGLSLVIYLLLAIWLAGSATTEEMVNNFTIMVDKAAWGPIVLAGLLGATFSSALSSTVGAPRILQALGTHKVMPGAGWFSETTEAGEPRNAMYLTGVLVLAALMLRDLNAVAPLITMFFLITYAMINVVVVIEQSLGLVSFRPLMRVPRIVPLLGAAGCLFAMFIVNPAFSLIAVVVVLVLYGYLIRRSLDAPFGDVRSGLFVAVAEWAAKHVSGLPKRQERAWKPNLLIPVTDTAELRGSFRFIHDVSFPKGSVRLLGLNTLEQTEDDFDSRLEALAETFHQEGVFASWNMLESDSYRNGVGAGMDTLGGSFFRPNILFLSFPQPERQAEGLSELLDKATHNEIGVLLFADHPKAQLGRRKEINLWVRDQSPDWELSMDIGNLDLGILISYKLLSNWKGHVNMITALKDDGQTEAAREFLDNLTQVARLPEADTHVIPGDFQTVVREAPQADINIFGLPMDVNFEELRDLRDASRSACAFVQDAGTESALA